MNEHDLSAGLRTIHRERAVLPGAPSIHQRVRGIQFDDIPYQRGWMPPFRTWRFQTMFSATKYIAAGVIVALFGGFLLTGILTTQQDDEAVPAAVTESHSPEPVVTGSPVPTVTVPPHEPAEPSIRTDILPGVALTVEEVEPGVFRVVNDGVRDLRSANNVGIVAGHDGGVWLYRKNRLIRLGDEQGHRWPADRKVLPLCSGCAGYEFAVDHDGTVWAAIRIKGAGREGRVIRSFDGTGWTTYEPLPDYPKVEGWPTDVERGWDQIQIGAKGEVVVYGTASGQGISDLFIGPPTAEGWSEIEVPEGTQDLVVTASGDLLAAGMVTGSSTPGIAVKRWADGTWQDWRFGPTEALSAASVYLGRDGTAWADAEYEASDDWHLIRLDGNGTRAWGDHHRWGPAAVGPDGSAWGDFGPCEGPSDRFDGEAWTCHLNDLFPHVSESGFAEDGSLWVLAEGAGRPYEDVYVITPEAVAATE